VLLLGQGAVGLAAAEHGRGTMYGSPEPRTSAQEAPDHVRSCRRWCSGDSFPLERRKSCEIAAAAGVDDGGLGVIKPASTTKLGSRCSRLGRRRQEGKFAPPGRRRCESRYGRGTVRPRKQVFGSWFESRSRALSRVDASADDTDEVLKRYVRNRPPVGGGLWLCSRG
jgi:hypothetical protein